MTLNQYISQLSTKCRSTAHVYTGQTSTNVSQYVDCDVISSLLVNYQWHMNRSSVSPVSVNSQARVDH